MTLDLDLSFLQRYSRKRIIFNSVLVFALVLFLLPQSLNAESLTDVFRTQAFTGSWQIFSKINFIGKFCNAIISIFCFIGLFITCMRIIDTMLYLSGKNIWDSVHDLKSKGKGQKGFGFMNMGKEIFNANYGVGLDAFMGFLMSLLPDIKSYSDYAEGRVAYNLSEDDTITSYMLKISLPTILTLFFFTIGFSGVLWNAFGNVVDAMATAAETLVDIELSNYVNRALNSGKSYSFGYDADSTKYGSMTQSIAKSINNKILSHVTTPSTDVKTYVGSCVDNWVNTNIYQESAKSEIASACNMEALMQDDNLAKNLKYSIVMNETPSYDGVSHGFYKVVSVADLLSSTKAGTSVSIQGLENTENMYIHVMISKKANADETQYFQVIEKGKKSSANNNKPSNNGPTNGSGAGNKNGGSKVTVTDD